MPEQQYRSSARCFAFIVNVKYYPDPFLVEMSRRTKLKKMEVGFYEPNVLYCPPEMGPILEAILDEREFKSLREVVKVAMVSALKNNNDDYATIYEIAIDAILDSEIHRRCNNSRQTRSVKKKIQQIKEQLVTLREKRQVEESHLSISFSGDVKRSLRELNYIFRR
jgi:hypothetical protein